MPAQKPTWSFGISGGLVLNSDDFIPDVTELWSFFVTFESFRLNGD